MAIVFLNDRRVVVLPDFSFFENFQWHHELYFAVIIIREGYISRKPWFQFMQSGKDELLVCSYLVSSVQQAGNEGNSR